MNTAKAETLDGRILQFKMMELPGQPRMMHMGTSYLVSDMDAEIRKLRALLTRYRDETPLGNQPHMIAHEVDAALGRI